MTKRILLTPIVMALLLLAGCHHSNHIIAGPTDVPTNVRIAQYNQIVATANDNLVQVVISLKDATVISPDTAFQFAQFQTAVAKATKGIAVVLAQPGVWSDKAVQIQNLVLSLVPPAGYHKLGSADSVQYQALVLAIDSIESTLKIMVQMAKEAPAPVTQ